MSQFDSLWYQSQLAKREPRRVESKASDDPESKLHDQISAECKRRSWLAIHSRMDRRSTNQVGCPDFIIAADGGRTFWVEAKRKGRKPTPQQIGIKCWLEKLGHKAAIVYSYEEFLQKVLK